MNALKNTTQKSPTFYISHGHKPIAAHANGIYITANDGKRYLDGCSGAAVVQVGHSHPAVLAAMHEQIDQLQFSYRTQFENQPAIDLGYKIVAHMPPGLDRVFFVSGGSEAVESAMKLVRQYHFHRGEHERTIFISRLPSYHGSTLGALSLTGYQPLQKPFEGTYQLYPKIPSPTQYRIPEGHTAESHAIACANELETNILAIGAHRIAGFVVEPIGGASTGAEVPHNSYFPRIQAICKQYGIPLILDEVLCGVGRTGRWLAADYWQIDADVICLAKGLGAGYAPLAAIVAKDEMVETVLSNGGFMHGFTYAGNPLACAAGCAVLDVIDNEGLVENAAKQGEYLLAQLQQLSERFDWIGDVRGRGLLLAIEFADKASKTPLPNDWKVSQTITDMAYDEGLLVYPRKSLNGIAGDHILIAPPLIITHAQCDELLGLLTKALTTFDTHYQKIAQNNPK
ncbi:aminotransferase family protein [Ostreibacterium oceani]|uniref:Aminotransferase class III-fold pyridoxal phosphate-dependent enzyme n=1 Tax=Ostreibacterium oceani TaxID=2654998 RepID=A0A6N7F0G9_9GAMM|nr:aspartate aminotransferase family protein [Ostreibacterium oceani]MPV85346.1 aminotransferase class III-fold pyridoxal phosphate-dependent enzyme [Ostreibacterium oceani]